MKAEATTPGPLPRVLVVDDMFGRTIADRPHPDRSSFVKTFRVRDITGDGSRLLRSAEVASPVAEAFFSRGQQPGLARAGDVVENDLEGTLSIIRRSWTERVPGTPPWALVVLDMCFYTGRVTEASESSDHRGPGMPEGRSEDSDPDAYFGLKLLRAIRQEFGDNLPVIVLSSMDARRIEDAWVRGGATHFIPRDSGDAPSQFREAIQRSGIWPDPTGKIVGTSLPLLQALREARNLGSDDHVLLLGETGVGKELLARYINRNAGKGKVRPLVTVNTPGIPAELLSSELFGHEKNAFTGAGEGRVGKFEQADGGDIFFDEVGYAVKTLQANLLRVLERKPFQRVGGTKDISVSVRFLAATDASPDENLLAPLRNRIHREISLPPLRERPEDISLLVRHLLDELRTGGVFDQAKEVDPEAMAMLQAYSWPGNIRELHRILREAAGGIFATVPRLAVVHLPDRVRHGPVASGSVHSAQNLSASEPERMPRGAGEAGVVPSGLALPSHLPESLPEAQRAVAAYLVQALEATRDPVTGKLVPTQAYRMILPEGERQVDKKRSNLTNQGAGVFKKLLNIHPPTVSILLRENPTLREVAPWVESRGGSVKP